MHIGKGASFLALRLCNVIQVLHHVPTAAGFPRKVEFGGLLACTSTALYIPVKASQGLASQHGKASVYPTRAAILLVSFSGRANSGPCPATLDIRLRCGRTTPYSVQVVKTCMSHAARRFAIQYNAGRHRNPACRFTSTIYTSTATSEDATSTSPAPRHAGPTVAFWLPPWFSLFMFRPSTVGMGSSSPLIRKATRFLSHAGYRTP